MDQGVDSYRTEYVTEYFEDASEQYSILESSYDCLVVVRGCTPTCNRDCSVRELQVEFRLAGQVDQADPTGPRGIEDSGT